MSFNQLSFKEELKIKITYYRKKSGLTQSEVAKKMGMTRSSYAYAETKASKLSPDFLTRLAAILGVSPSVFIENYNEEQPELSNPAPVPPPPFSATKKEQRIIKMLRMLSDENFNKHYNAIREDYEITMNEDD